VSHADGLGQFALGYLGETGQRQVRWTLGGTYTVSTQWNYLSNGADRRLWFITNRSGSQTRQHFYTTTAEDLVSSVYDGGSAPGGSWSFGYDDANRLLSASLSGAAAPWGYTLDPAGTLPYSRARPPPTRRRAITASTS
jgi:hypothetical protein